MRVAKKLRKRGQENEQLALADMQPDLEEITALINPQLDIGSHVSDWAGRHITRFDIKANKDAEDHITKVLDKALLYTQDEIVET